jgi:hypothetical protein
MFVTMQTACRKTITGAVGARVQNVGPGLPARIQIDSNHQSLARINSTNGAGGACSVLPNDASARWTNPTQGDLVFNVAPTNFNVNVTP